MTQALDTLLKAGEGSPDTTPLGDGIFMSRGVANTYLITTSHGDVQINTGLHFESKEIKARFARVSQGPLRAIVFTQGHPDHVYGWSDFNAAGVETIAQANHIDVREYWRRLHPFYVRRIMKLWGQSFGDVDTSFHAPEPVLTQTFIDAHTFELGGRCFELFSTPGGETTDALVVWLPKEKTVFIGNLMGPMFGHVPNLYTVRGDKIRSAMAFIRSIERVMALHPETLINGHEVFRGAEQIQQTMAKVRDAALYLRDRTIEGMNARKSLWTLMREVTLPPELAMPQLHGKLPWVVRAIWEEHAGWFRYESTTELYDVPASAIWSDLIELTRGPAALTERARTHIDQSKPLHALHLLEIVLQKHPRDEAALQLKRAALEQLLAASGRENFSEVQWLETEIAETRRGEPATP